MIFTVLNKLRLPIFSKAQLHVALFLFISTASANTDKQPYEILRSIRTPQELLRPVMPPDYCVPITLSGSIADEMNAALKNLNLEKPDYSESFNGNAFQLLITNESYPEQTRSLLSGVLNPLEMIDIIIQSLVKYKSPDKFSVLQAETNCAIKKDSTNPSLITLKITPKGNRFSYNYEDNGAYIQESFLVEMSITLDTSTHLVHEIKSMKRSRQFSTDAADEPSFDSTQVRYVFTYDHTINNMALPVRLQIVTGNSQSLEINASYRSTNDKVLFAKKSILSRNGETESNLVIVYNDYTFTQCKFKNSTPGQANKRLLAAAALSRKALESMRQGNISASARTLREIADKYHDTPQAIEARRLLSQLPSDLR